MTTAIKHSSLRAFAVFTRDQAGKGQTLAALTQDYNDSAMHFGFDFLMIGKPGRVAKLVELMNHVISRLDAMPEYAERVPDVTPEKRAEHLEHAEHLRGILRSHGIDAKDFDACMDYIIGNGNIVPRYWAKIYMDYIYGDDLDATAFDLAKPGTERTVFVDLEGRDVVSITAANPADANTARVLQDVINHGIGAFSADLEAGHTIHHALERVILGAPDNLACDMADALRYAMTTAPDINGHTHSVFDYGKIEQVILPSLSVPTVGFYQCMGRGFRYSEQQRKTNYARAHIGACKINRLPRGKCAQRMQALGWVFNF